MAREWVWYTRVGGLTNQTDMSVSLVTGPGTVQRIIGQLFAGRSDSGVGSFASFHYIVGVGAAAPDPNVFGQDADTTMLHGAIIAPNPATAPIRLDPPAVALESEGQRVLSASEQLWLRIRGGAPATAWSWAYSIRVLVLLPDA